MDWTEICARVGVTSITKPTSPVFRVTYWPAWMALAGSLMALAVMVGFLFFMQNQERQRSCLAQSLASCRPRLDRALPEVVPPVRAERRRAGSTSGRSDSLRCWCPRSRAETDRTHPD